MGSSGFAVTVYQWRGHLHSLACWCAEQEFDCQPVQPDFMTVIVSRIKAHAVKVHLQYSHPPDYSAGMHRAMFDSPTSTSL